MALVLDTGPLLAALDAADPAHATCAELLVNAYEDLVIPALVLAEVDYWCAERLGIESWITFLHDVVDGVYRVEAPTQGDLVRSLELQRQYSDLGIGVVDATVLALVERLQEPKLATLDQRHFRAMRPRHRDVLTIWPADLEDV